MSIQRVDIGPATLYCGDCLEILPILEQVDHVIADPPYGERTHSGQRHGRRDERYADGWVTARGLEYEHLSPQGARELAVLFRAVARRWVLVMTSHDLAPEWEASFGGYTFAPVPIVMRGMNVRLAGDGPSSWCVWLMVNRPIGHKDGTKPGAYVGSPGAGPDRSENVVKGHKPLWLMDALIADYTSPDDVVLDSHAGSGTTGVAAIRAGRRFIGIERDARHFDIACSRIEAAHAQGRLFAEPDARPEQGTML